MEFRPLTKDEIECRVGVCTEKGCSVLLYKDARVDRAILDETVGNVNWQDRFYECKGNLFCSVGILIYKMNDDKTTSREWVWKDDCGAPSNMEAEKGEASDAFKRACFKWGIGIELYTSPFVWIPADKCNIGRNKQGKPTCYDRFRCEKVRIENGSITGLSIYNDTKNCRAFTWVKEEK